VQRRVDAAQQRLDHAGARLGRPLARLSAQEVLLGRAAHRLHYAMHGRLAREAAHHADAQQKLAGALRRRFDDAHRTMERSAIRLELLDPRLLLRRGYALLRTDEGTPVTSAAQTHPGQSLTAALVDGEVDVAVRAVRRPSP
jgi:exodeoxyribonuclease VII large subunit